MTLRKYKMLIVACPYPIEWIAEVSKGIEIAFKKAKGEIKNQYPELKIGKLISYEKIAEREV